MVVPGEVEEPEQVVMADVEEEMARPGVVPVLDQLHQRKSEELLVELDRLLQVPADQREMMDTLDRAGGPLPGGPQVSIPQLLPVRPDLLEFLSLWPWHGLA